LRAVGIGADVEELPDAGGTGQVADRIRQERPLGPDATTQPRVGRQGPLRRLAVDGVIVLPPSQWS